MIAASVFFLLGCASAGGATMTQAQKHGHCRVVAGEKYLKPPLGAESICAEVERALAVQTPKAKVSAEVKVMSPSRLVATLVVNGRTLPEHKFAVMDSDLSPEAAQRFAQALARAVAETVKR